MGARLCRTEPDQTYLTSRGFLQLKQRVGTPLRSPNWRGWIPLRDTGAGGWIYDTTSRAQER